MSILGCFQVLYRYEYCTYYTLHQIINHHAYHHSSIIKKLIIIHQQQLSSSSSQRFSIASETIILCFISNQEKGILSFIRIAKQQTSLKAHQTDRNSEHMIQNVFKSLANSMYRQFYCSSPD